MSNKFYNSGLSSEKLVSKLLDLELINSFYDLESDFEVIEVKSCKIYFEKARHRGKLIIYKEAHNKSKNLRKEFYYYIVLKDDNNKPKMILIVNHKEIDRIIDNSKLYKNSNGDLYYSIYYTHIKSIEKVIVL